LGIGIPSEVLMRPEVKIDENSVSGWVVKNRKPLLIDDISEDKRFSGKSLGNYSSDSLMCVPIISKETVLGVISVTDRKTGISFSQADLELLAMLGNLIAVIIENIKLYNKMKITIDKLNKKNLEISSLSELDDFLGSLNDEIEVANYSIINSIEFLKAEYGSIYFINSKTDKMEKISQAGKIKSNQKISEFEIKAFKMIQENRRSCIVNSENPPVGFDSILIEENIIQGFMILPMINEKELYGAMFFINKRFGNDFNTSDLKFASALSDLILRRIERKRLYRMIILNRETGLYKKDFFIARLCEEISRARRYSREISLAAFIIEGYEILSASIKESEKNNFFQKLASIFTDHIRQVDMVTMHDDARFLFLLPETGIQGARIFSERLINKLDAFQESIFFDRKFDFYAGISVYSGEIKGISEKEIIYQAFYAADEAAAEGGQRVLLFNE
jgi:GAF domain-containing protein